ncbi:uncharacterized protein LOC116347487 isoform X2 [Contarinia nasturtii]|uniref:uncharacterized protein LOC116347487 isoform X2 n=1 Tax=Contarinia nasturtii TaxID=265458 RepID=UPI0012D4341F|nr:uncharacterized protein LOC116347487 isoform X2 [Contarinia nasturtii]
MRCIKTPFSHGGFQNDKMSVGTVFRRRLNSLIASRIMRTTSKMFETFALVMAMASLVSGNVAVASVASPTIGFTEQPQFQPHAAALISSPSASDSVSASSSTSITKPDYGITNVTAQIGTNAYLPCKVRLVFNKSVSWVRVRDDHILTVDQITFIADERFHAYHATENSASQSSAMSTLSNQRQRQLSGSVASKPNNDHNNTSTNSANAPWTLQIKFVQARDAGLYECQISAEPKISARVYLHVVVPKTEPMGDTVRYVKEGSRVTLHCVISGAIDPPLYVIWYHGQQQIFSDNTRHWKTEVSHQDVNSNKLVKASDENEALALTQQSMFDSRKTVGSLFIPAIKKKDSGNYTCCPSNSPSVTIVLHVINGEYSASAITSSSSSSSGSEYQRKSFNRFLNIVCFGITLITLLITT